MPIQTLFGPPPPPSLLDRFKQAVSTTRETLGAKLEEAVRGRAEIDAQLLKELEISLLSADLGVATTQDLLNAVKERASRESLGGDVATAVRNILKQELL